MNSKEAIDMIASVDLKTWVAVFGFAGAVITGVWRMSHHATKVELKLDGVQGEVHGLREDFKTHVIEEMPRVKQRLTEIETKMTIWERLFVKVSNAMSRNGDDDDGL